MKRLTFSIVILLAAFVLGCETNQITGGWYRAPEVTAASKSLEFTATVLIPRKPGIMDSYELNGIVTYTLSEVTGDAGKRESGSAREEANLSMATNVELKFAGLTDQQGSVSRASGYTYQRIAFDESPAVEFVDQHSLDLFGKNVTLGIRYEVTRTAITFIEAYAWASETENDDNNRKP
ncbi:MAG: hypothetical protein ACRDGA_03775 [Bacteroidota bacterium]